MHALGREVANAESRDHGKFVAGSVPEDLRKKMSEAGKYYASHESRDERGRFTGLAEGSSSGGVDMHKVRAHTTTAG
jgi:hypothetical protein